jgi:hypothetical protein
VRVRLRWSATHGSVCLCLVAWDTLSDGHAGINFNEGPVNRYN